MTHFLFLLLAATQYCVTSILNKEKGVRFQALAAV